MRRTYDNNHIHARSVESGAHPSRHWVKNFWSQIRADIPPGWRVCGENLFTTHSIPYTDLESYFLGCSVWYRAAALYQPPLTQDVQQQGQRFLP